MKTLGFAPSLMFQSHVAVSNDNQALTAMTCIPSIREVQFSQQIMSILENIEPDIVCAGHDNTQPDVPHLLNSLNRLCEKQLLWIVKWSKSLPGKRPQHRDPMASFAQGPWGCIIVINSTTYFQSAEYDGKSGRKKAHFMTI